MDTVLKNFSTKIYQYTLQISIYIFQKATDCMLRNHRFPTSVLKQQNLIYNLASHPSYLYIRFMLLFKLFLYRIHLTMIKVITTLTRPE
jgi:hypothetical protein